MDNIKITKENLSYIDTVTSVLNVLSIGNIGEKFYTVEGQSDVNVRNEFFCAFLEYYAILIINQFKDLSKDETDYELSFAVPEKFEAEIKNLEMSGELPLFVNFKKEVMKKVLKNIKNFKNKKIPLLSEITTKTNEYLNEIKNFDDRKSYEDKIERFTEYYINNFTNKSDNINTERISMGCAVMFFTYEHLINNNYENMRKRIRERLNRTEISLNPKENLMLFLIQIYKYWLLSGGKNYFLVKDKNEKNFTGKLTIDDKPVYRDKSFGLKYIALLLYMNFESMTTLPLYTSKDKTGCDEKDILTVNIEDNIWYAPNNISDKNNVPESEIIRNYYILDPELEKYAGGRTMMGNFISSANMIKRAKRNSNEFREMYELSTRYDKKTFYKKMYLEFNKIMAEFKNKEPDENEKVFVDLTLNFKKSGIMVVENIEIQKALYINKRQYENSLLKNSILVYNPNITNQSSMDYKMLTVRAYILDYVTEKNPEYTKETIQLISDIVMFFFSQNFELFTDETLMRSHDYMTEIAMYMSKVLNNEISLEIKDATETITRVFEKSFEIYIDLLSEIGYNPQGRTASVDIGAEQEKQFDLMWEQMESKAVIFDLKK